MERSKPNVGNLRRRRCCRGCSDGGRTSCCVYAASFPKPRFRKKKTHGKANARGLTGAEVAALELKAREELARTRAAVTPEAEVIGVLVQGAEERRGDEFQGGSSVALAIRSPEGPPRAPPAQSPIAVDPVTFRLFPEDPYAPPASTVAPKGY